MTTGTRLVVLLLLVGTFCVEAEDVTCKDNDNKKTSKKITVKDGDSFSFKTQAGTEYGGKVNCKVTYKRDNSCPALRFSCESFALSSTKGNCKGGDRMTVVANGAKQKYCQDNSPDVTTNGKFIRVFFVSNKKTHDTGAVCSVECVTTSATTPTSSTTTPTISTTTPTISTTTPTISTTTQGSGDCKCGLAQRSSRIVGGQVTEVSEYPWQVGMVNKNGNDVWCGASVISTQYILTAAHCVQGQKASKIQVLLGEHDYSTSSETTMVRRDISQIIKHGSYNHGTTDYDFALLKMKTAINFDDYPHIRPICLPEDDSKDYNDFVATVTGWGTLSSGGSVSSKLREVDVKVQTNNECQNSDYPSSWITDQMLCAEAASGNGGKDACQGDSGGPLVTSGSGDGVTAGQNYELIGVVSWGQGCAAKNNPGVYSRVTAQLSWIKTNGDVSGNTCPRT